MNEQTQAKIDSLKSANDQEQLRQISPFNPNFITDYKGYVLGMSPEEIDRLHKFRSANRFLHSAEEFQSVTGISDSLLNRISIHFVFPKWTESPRKTPKKRQAEGRKIAAEPADLNRANPEDLMKIYGVGEILAGRIVKFRDALGGFLEEEQLYDVYGLEKEVANRVLAKFAVFSKPVVNRINVNTATEEDIADLVYISRSLARRIIVHREEYGQFDSWDELKKIQGFPADKINRIKLYLTL